MANEHKRGAKLYWADKKMDVWLDRVVSHKEYFVCDSPARGLEDNYYTVPVNELSDDKQIGKPIAAKPKTLTPEDKKAKAELNTFYAEQTLIPAYLCENCNQPLLAFNQFEKRATIAHILPKSGKQSVGFPTVATHPQNKMFLGAKCGCHAKWDFTNAATRKTMWCYPIALIRYSKFYEKLTDEEIIKAQKYLGIEQ